MLDARLNFDEFVGGTSNQLALAAALAVSEVPGKVYNPLVICGDAGMGKTHLLHAIGNAIVRKNPDHRVCCYSAEVYISNCLEAFCAGQRASFRDSLCIADILLLDGLEPFVGKVRVQEELFCVLNTLLKQGRQIVITADKVPARMPGFFEGLRFCLEKGLVVEIAPPCLETRLATIAMMASELELSESVQGFLLAYGGAGTIREVERLMTKFRAYRKVTGKEIGLAAAWELAYGKKSSGMNLSRRNF